MCRSAELPLYMRKSDNSKGGFRKDKGSFGKGTAGRGKSSGTSGSEGREKRSSERPERRKSPAGFRKEEDRRGGTGAKRSGDRERRSFEGSDKRREGGGFRKDHDRKESGPGAKRSGDRERRSFDGAERKTESRGFRKDHDREERRTGAKRSGDRERRSYDGTERKREGGGFRRDDSRKGKDSGAGRSDDRERGSFGDAGKRKTGSDFRKDGDGRSRSGDGKNERPERRRNDSDAGSSGQRPFERFRKNEIQRELNDAWNKKKERPKREQTEDRPARLKAKEEESGLRRVKYDEFEDGRAFSARKDQSVKGHKPGKKSGQPAKSDSSDGMIRLNKYLSNAGVASRREADTLIQSGVVKVNGEVVTQLGHKIHPGDRVTYGDAAVRSERKVYLLLNKPKDYITTVDDPQERKTVMELIAKACKERVYPVGRLDRNTTGLLLFTNDGELTKKLTHPKYGIKKVYHVSLNKGLKAEDFKAIAEGMELEDGPIKADDIAFVGEGKKEIGIEIHSGRNRIVRRIFEQLGYDVLKLDRVAFAGLTKKDLPRGKYRFLTAKEVGFLQMIG